VPTLEHSPVRRDLAISAALLLVAAALAALLAVRAPLGLDYVGQPGVLCDCAATPIRALAHGRVHEFLVTQPLMGSVSLLLRAPFAAVGLHLGHGSDLDLYRLGAFPCLLAAGLLAVYLFRRMRELRRPPLACLLVPALVAVNPLTTRATDILRSCWPPRSAWLRCSPPAAGEGFWRACCSGPRWPPSSGRYSPSRP